MNIAMPQPGCRAFRPTGTDPLQVEWHSPMSCRSAEEGIPRWLFGHFSLFADGLVVPPGGAAQVGER